MVLWGCMVLDALPTYIFECVMLSVNAPACKRPNAQDGRFLNKLVRLNASILLSRAFRLQGR